MCIGIIRNNSLVDGRARAESNPGHWARHALLHMAAECVSHSATKAGQESGHIDEDILGKMDSQKGMGRGTSQRDGRLMVSSFNYDNSKWNEQARQHVPNAQTMGAIWRMWLNKNHAFEKLNI